MTPRMLMSALAACLLLLSATARAEPHRIVSLNMCADQYLIALADPGQVASLSEYARDPSMSYYAERAKTYPVIANAAEAVITLKPDLVIVNRLRKQELQAILKPYGYATVELRPAKTFEDIVDQTRQIATAIGHPDRGETLIARMRSALDAVPRTYGPRPVAVHYQRRGFITGTGTLLDDIMKRAGVENLAGRLGKKAISRVSLEEIVAARPDYLLYSDRPERGTDLGTDLLLHPVLADRYGAGRQLYLPGALTICGGPAFPEAVSRLYRQAHP